MSIQIRVQQVNAGKGVVEILAEEYQSDELTIGRSSSNDVVLAEPDVSGAHAKLRISPESSSETPVLLVSDLGSSNGTYLEDKRLAKGEEVALQADQRVVIGTFIISASCTVDVVESEVGADTIVEVDDEPIQDEVSVPIEVELAEEESAASESVRIDDVAPEDEIVDSLESASLSTQVSDDALAIILDDPSVSQVIIRSFDSIVIDRGGVLEASSYCYSSAEALARVLKDFLGSGGVILDAEHPVASLHLPSGLRISATLSPISKNGPSAFVSRFTGAEITLEQLTKREALTDDVVELLSTAMRNGLNVVLTGAATTGKTTLLGALVKEFSKAASSAVLQRGEELQIPANSFSFTRELNPIDGGDALIHHLASLRLKNLFVDDSTSAELSRLLQVLSGISQVTATSKLPSARHLVSMLMQSETALRDPSILALSVPIILELDFSEEIGRVVRSVVAPEVVDGTVALTTVFERRDVDGTNLLLSTGAAPHFMERVGEQDRKALRKRLSGS